MTASRTLALATTGALMTYGLFAAVAIGVGGASAYEPLLALGILAVLSYGLAAVMWLADGSRSVRR